MALDNCKNFAKVTVSTGYDADDTSIALTENEGAKLPTAPFNVVWYDATTYSDPTDDPNREIVRVTEIATDTLTVTRAQESTTAATHNTGGKTYKMIAGLTAKVINTDLKTYNDTLYAPVLGAQDNYVTDAEKAVIGNTSGTNSGNETATSVGALVNAAGAATPNDTDLVATAEAAGLLKKITWTNVKAFLKTYFDTLYATVAGFTLTGEINLGENAGLLLDAALSGDAKYSGIVEGGTAGATLAFGDLCYKDPTDSKWELADANVITSADGDARGTLGVCVLDAEADAATKMLIYGKVRAATFPAFTVNERLFVSETAGDVTHTAPTTTDSLTRVVGVALTAEDMLFNPSPDYYTHV